MFFLSSDHLSSSFFLIGTSKSGIKYKGEIDVPNLSDENDKDDLDVSNSGAQNTWSLYYTLLVPLEAHWSDYIVCIYAGRIKKSILVIISSFIRNYKQFSLFVPIFSCRLYLFNNCGFCFLLGVQISVSLCKDEPDTPLFTLMKKEGAEKVRDALTSYVELLKTGQPFSHSLWQPALLKLQ